MPTDFKIGVIFFMTRIKAYCRQTGFTLLEILIPITIISVIIIALYSAFALSKKAVDAVDNSLIRLQEARNMIDVLKRELESSFFYSDKSYSVFKITNRDIYDRQIAGITFTAFTHLLPGVCKISYTVEGNRTDKTNGGHKSGLRTPEEDFGQQRLALIKRITSAYSDNDKTEGVELMEDVESFTIEAKYADMWVKTWDSEMINNIPAEVKISISVNIGNEKKRITVSDTAKLRIGKAI
ncbi:MAG: prepilin-type N-terminal cleavage/methylation domain-containing protein [Thermodesulfovibrionales bacterium]|nr:prepilin-type N-terminal cleavage/methylation domain-containing protein [Thermodesulfovibrionales bacterium]